MEIPQDPPITTILLDAAAIQSYVFGSNRLKENVGASHIIAHELYGNLLTNCIETVIGDPAGLSTDWKDGAAPKMASDHNLQAEIGYIGGGNALILFRQEKCARQFLKEYSLWVLCTFPALRLVSAWDASTTFHELQHDYNAVRVRLEQKLKEQKHQTHRNLLVDKPGIVADCPLSNDAAETIHREHRRESWIGMAAMQRLAAADSAPKSLNSQRPAFLDTDFSFTLELEELSQDEEKGYIAIVHIDGNGIGAMFSKCKSLAELRKLSVEVATAANEAMRLLVDELSILLCKGAALSQTISLKENPAGGKFLPIRPLLVGGDDVVFVCDGRLGVHLAERYIHFFKSEMRRFHHQAHACAGVAIVKTKYPFYRAYQLAEELMRKAKEAIFDNKKDPFKDESESWLAFLVASTGFNGDLCEILEQQFKAGNLELFGGPYQLSGDKKPLLKLKEGAAHLQKWPRNKVMELRDMLTQPEEVQAYFMESLHARGLELPGRLPNKNSDTPGPQRLLPEHFGAYMDMIELMKFYPQELLQCN